jgi:transcriptional regulator with XRE-family HTH domain
VARGYLAQLEAGHKRNSSLPTLRKLAKALGVPVTELLGMTSDRQDTQKAPGGEGQPTLIAFDCLYAREGSPEAAVASAPKRARGARRQPAVRPPGAPARR